MAKSKKKKTSSGSATVTTALAVLLLIALLAFVWFFIIKQDTGLSPSSSESNPEGLSKEEVTQELQNLADTYAATNMVIEADGTVIELTPEEAGISLDVDAAADGLYETYSSGSAANLEEYLTLDTDAVRSAVDDLAENVYSEYVDTSYYVEGDDPAAGQTLYITKGSPSCVLDADGLYHTVLSAYYYGEFYAQGICETEEPDDLDLQAVYDEYYIAPVDASIDPETNEVIKESYGYGFDLTEAEYLLSNAASGETVEILFEQIPPEVTAEDLEADFQDVLSTCSTPHTWDEDRTTNLRLACEAINGMVLNPGDVFSFNDALGERTAERGYRPGASYENGETVLTYGGGICQVSSTLYYCSLIADLQIVERYCHMYTPDYIDYGMDATVNWGTLDFQFRNDSEHPIRIDAYVADGYVTVTLMGTDNKDYYVDMDYYITDVYDYDTVYEEYTADNEEGYYDGETITSPIIGYGVETYRCKYDKETNELIREEYEDYSDYDHRDAVICKIVSSETTSNDYGFDDYFTGSGGGISPDGG